MTGLLLCLPITTIVAPAILDIGPHFGPLQPLLTGPDGRMTTWMPLGAILLLPLALIVSALPARRTVRVGGALLAHPANLALATVILAGISLFVVGFVADQYPCWIGVPDCD